MMKNVIGIIIYNDVYKMYLNGILGKRNMSKAKNRVVRKKLALKIKLRFVLFIVITPVINIYFFWMECNDSHGGQYGI